MLDRSIPKQLLDSLEGIKGFDRIAFEQEHLSRRQITSVRLNPLKLKMDEAAFQIESKVPWASNALYLKERPSFTFDPLFHAGCYYVQEASSMFLEQALIQSVDLSKPIRVLDLCGAPGGKSTHIQSLINDNSLLVSNEAIRSRTRILTDNIIKWGATNVVVTNNDPSAFAKLENYFDVIVIDAPCSGSGLFRRDPEAIDEWSESNVQLCCQRQQRIIADSLPSLRKNGILIYSTCSYSPDEDEEIADWILNDFDMENVRLTTAPEWNIVETTSPQHSAYSYRFFPHKVKGEGLYVSVFRKNDGGEESKLRSRKSIPSVTKNLQQIAAGWTNNYELLLVQADKEIAAIRKDLSDDIAMLTSYLNVEYFGTRIGEVIRDKMIPHHALAMSRIFSEDIPVIDLDYDLAIQYLKKKDIKPEASVKGWNLVCYQKNPLGWVNVLPNRVNNYYPKELRILKN